MRTSEVQVQTIPGHHVDMAIPRTLIRDGDASAAVETEARKRELLDTPSGGP